MKKQIKSKIAMATMLSLLVSCLAGCGKQPLDTQTVIDNADDIETIEVNQNDYRGGIKRIEAIRGNVLNIVNGFNEKNFEIQAEFPCSYWSSEEYQYFIAHFINGEIYQYTDLFNEFETDWATVDTTVKGMLANSEGNLPQNFALERVTDNHYTLSFREQNAMAEWWESPNDTIWFWDCIYNPTHDWVQTIQYGYPTSGSEKTHFQTQFLEYGRRENVFIIQTEYERLYVVYENTEPVTVENTSMYVLNNKGKEIPVTQEDIDSGAVNIEDVQYHTNSIVTYNPLKNNTIKAFYYSRLDGNILPQYYSEEDDGLEEADGLGTRGAKNEMVNYDLVLTPEGYLKNQYNTCDSIFPHIDDITKDWVTEMGTYQQVVVYENGDLTVKTANQLSHLYEIFKFYSNGNVENSTEPMVVPEPTVVSANDVQETVSGDDAQETTELSTYNLYEIGKNCSGLGEVTIGDDTFAIPINVTDFNTHGFELDINDLNSIDNADLCMIDYRANVLDDTDKATGDYVYIGSSSDTLENLDDVDVQAIIVSREGVENGLSISVCGVSIGTPLDTVREKYGNGVSLNDGIGYYDGVGYLYIQTDLLTDEEDREYYGISNIVYVQKSWVEGLYSEDVEFTTEDETEDETDETRED